MSRYLEFFLKFQKIGQIDFDSFDDFCRVVYENLEVEGDYSLGDAILVLGYSGNGKTTWINQFLKLHPEYRCVSMDEVGKKLLQEGKNVNNPYLMVEEFGREIDACARSKTPIILDGRFLNLLTRCCLSQTLHSYGYFVHAVDLTDDILKILPYRIFDYCGRDLGVKITNENVSALSRTPVFQRRYQDIMRFYEREKQSSFFEEQKKNGSIYYDIDGIISKDVVLKSPNKESNK